MPKREGGGAGVGDGLGEFFGWVLCMYIRRFVGVWSGWACFCFRFVEGNGWAVSESLGGFLERTRGDEDGVTYARACWAETTRSLVDILGGVWYFGNGGETLSTEQGVAYRHGCDSLIRLSCTASHSAIKNKRGVFWRRISHRKRVGKWGRDGITRIRVHT